MDYWLVLRIYWVILNQWTKWNNRSFKWLPKTSFIGCPPIRWKICDVSQIGVTVHRICPPTFIQTWLQQYSRGAFLYSAHCSFSNPIGFWSVWCRRAMIPGEIFASFAEFQGIVSVNDFWFPLGFQELFARFSGFLVKFLFCTDTPGSIEWQDPVLRLHIDDCFEIRNCRWGPWDLLLSSPQNLQLEVRLRHCVFCTGPL